MEITSAGDKDSNCVRAKLFFVTPEAISCLAISFASFGAANGAAVFCTSFCPVLVEGFKDVFSANSKINIGKQLNSNKFYYWEPL